MTLSARVVVIAAQDRAYLRFGAAVGRRAALPKRSTHGVDRRHLSAVLPALLLKPGPVVLSKRLRLPCVVSLSRHIRSPSRSPRAFALSRIEPQEAKEGCE